MAKSIDARLTALEKAHDLESGVRRVYSYLQMLRLSYDENADVGPPATTLKPGALSLWELLEFTIARHRGTT